MAVDRAGLTSVRRQVSAALVLLPGAAGRGLNSSRVRWRPEPVSPLVADFSSVLSASFSNLAFSNLADHATPRAGGWPLVRVVKRADFGQLEGVISQHDVLERYREFGEG